MKIHYIPPNSFEIMLLSEEYPHITEESVLQDYLKFCSQQKYTTEDLENFQLYLDHVRVILWRKKIPEDYAKLLAEAFDDVFFRRDFILKINTFAKLRLAYDYFLHPWGRELINQRYKTLAIMMDPEMNVIKHNLEFLYLKLFGWRYWQ